MAIRLRFLGAARNVTGSRTLVEAGGARVLVDCGLHQEREFLGRDWESFPVEPASIGAVCLTHGHLDHCGLLPRLAARGFRGRILCTPATAEIAPIVLADAAHLQEEDARFKAKRHRREGRRGPRPPAPLFTARDAEGAARLFSPVGYGSPVAAAPGIRATFHEAGHILGAAAILVEASDGEKTRKILFSGDVGRANRPILRDPETFATADIVVIESTYGDRVHPAETDEEETLSRIVSETAGRGGAVVVPSFAIGRAQEVLYRLHLLRRAGRIPPLPVFLDSPMAVGITEVFMRHPELFDEEMRALLRDHASPFSFAGLSLVRTREESKALNDLKGPAVIIAGSGMCTGGRIKHHLAHHIGRPECAVLFVGYQASGTLGRRIVEGESPVRIFGQNFEVRARVAQIHGFSGHADREELLAWVSRLAPPPGRILVNHGGPNVSAGFAAFLQARLGLPASAPTYGETVEL